VFWDGRYGVIEDPFGHSWSAACHSRDRSAEEMQQATQKMAN
jgi:PhnB protein